MTVRSSRYVPQAIGICLAVAAGFVLSGCSPDTTFAGFSDERMKDLFPTEAEVASAVAGMVSLGDTSHAERTSPSPRETAATLPAGVSENCRDVYLGTDETRALNAASVRTFEREGYVGDHQLRWRLMQFPSAAVAKRLLDVYRDIGEKCDQYSMFDLDVQSGWGQAISPGGTYAGSSAILSVGDVTLSIALTEFSRDEAEAVAKKMASTMERRIRASSATK